MSFFGEGGVGSHRIHLLLHPVLWREMEERGVCKTVTLENLTTHQNSKYKRKDTQEPKPRKKWGFRGGGGGGGLRRRDQK